MILIKSNTKNLQDFASVMRGLEAYIKWCLCELLKSLQVFRPSVYLSSAHMTELIMPDQIKFPAAEVSPQICLNCRLSKIKHHLHTYL